MKKYLVVFFLLIALQAAKAQNVTSERITCTTCHGTGRCVHCNGTGELGYRMCGGVKQEFGCRWCGGTAGADCYTASRRGSGICSRCGGQGVIINPEIAIEKEKARKSQEEADNTAREEAQRKAYMELRRKKQEDDENRRRAKDTEDKKTVERLKGISSSNLGIGTQPAPRFKTALIRIGAAALIKGVVKVQRGDGQPFILRPGMPVQLNDRIITGDNSKLQGMLLDETVFTLGPGSDMVLDEFVYDPSSSPEKITARVLKGTFRWVSGKVAHDSVKVNLPSGTIGIRGTDFQIKISPAGNGSIKLYKGALEITESKTGRVFQMKAKQMVLFTASGDFGLPAELKTENELVM